MDIVFPSVWENGDAGDTVGGVFAYKDGTSDLELGASVNLLVHDDVVFMQPISAAVDKKRQERRANLSF